MQKYVAPAKPNIRQACVTKKEQDWKLFQFPLFISPSVSFEWGNQVHKKVVATKQIWTICWTLNISILNTSFRRWYDKNA